MAQLAVGAVGAVIGFYLGGPAGASLGWSLGSAIGAGFGPAQKVQGPRLADLKVSAVEYGASIARLYGGNRVPGAVVWASSKREIPSVTRTGGKGGPSIEASNYTYQIDVLYLVSERQIGGVRRVWANGELVWTAATESTENSLGASAVTNRWAEMRVYTGASNQLPDPVYETAVGIGNAPAYRGRGTVFLESIELGPSGQLPVFTFEVFDEAGIEPLCVEVRPRPWHNWDYVAGWVDIDQIPPPGAGVELNYAWCYPSGVAGTLKTTIPVSGCKRYFEILINENSSSAQEVAWLLIRDGDGNAFGMKYSGAYTTNGSDNLGAIIYSDGDPGNSVWDPSPITIGFALDCDTGKLWIYRHEAGGDPHWWGPDESPDPNPSTLTNGRSTGLSGQDLVIELVHQAQIPNVTLHLFTSVDSPGNPNTTVLPDGFSWWSSDTADTVRVTPGTIYLDEVVADICTQAGLAASDYDVTELAGIEVNGLAITQAAPARSSLEALAAAYYFDAFEADKIYFVLRGGSSAASFTHEDLCAGEDTASDEDPIGLDRGNDAEVPAAIALSYSNYSNDYQAGTVYSDRMIGASAEERPVQVPLVFEPEQAQGIADTMVMDGRIAATRFKVRLDSTQPQLSPTDVVTVSDVDGISYRMRLVREVWSAGVREFEAVLDDSSVLHASGITESSWEPSITVNAAGVSILEVMDIPILRDEDDDRGVYVVAKSESGGRWPGAEIVVSTDNTTDFASFGTIINAGVFGLATTALDDYTGQHLFDLLSTVTVDVGDGTLSSATRDDLLDNGVNTALIGDEVVQFLTATLQSAGVYELRGFIRGRRGTERAMTGHVAADRFVLLRTTGLLRAVQDVAATGATRYWRAVTLGQAVLDAQSESLVLEAVALKPFSPVNLRLNRNVPGVVTVTWDRRTRYRAGELQDGSDVPLGQASEIYLVTVNAAGGGGVVDTQTVYTSSVNVTPSTGRVVTVQQIANGLAVGYPATITI